MLYMHFEMRVQARFFDRRLDVAILKIDEDKTFLAEPAEFIFSLLEDGEPIKNPTFSITSNAGLKPLEDVLVDLLHSLKQINNIENLVDLVNLNNHCNEKTISMLKDLIEQLKEDN